MPAKIVYRAKIITRVANLAVIVDSLESFLAKTKQSGAKKTLQFSNCSVHLNRYRALV